MNLIYGRTAVYDWISVEIKPSKGQLVLVAYHPFNKPENGYVYAVCMVNEYCEFLSTECDEFVEFATHWQPISEIK